MIPVNVLGKTIYQVSELDTMSRVPIGDACITCGRHSPAHQSVRKKEVMIHPVTILGVGNDLVFADFTYISNGDYPGVSERLESIDYPFQEGKSYSWLCPVFSSRDLAQAYKESLEK